MPSQLICSPPSPASMFLVLTVNDAPESREAVRDFLGDFPGLTRTVSFRSPKSNLLSVVGVGADLWEKLFPEHKPKHLHRFEEIRGAKHTAVSTPGDLLVHLRAADLDMCFELARLISIKLGEHTTVVDEVHGFKYFDQRDLLGFVDGTENPEGSDADEAVTITEEEDPEFAGGSYVIAQKYLHTMKEWYALSTEEQEKVIGRTKLDDVELDDDVKPSNSHVALNDIADEDGNDLDIYRLNMAFGSVGDNEYGTYFIGYAKDPSITERMLRNMFIGEPEGNYDRILDFSEPKTGALFFIPSAEFLEELD